MIYDLQKANMWKRASAALFDVIILGMVVVGLATLLSVILKYDSYNTTLQNAYDKYEQKYGVEFEISYEEYEKKTEEWKEQMASASDADKKKLQDNIEYAEEDVKYLETDATMLFKNSNIVFNVKFDELQNIVDDMKNAL